MSNSNFQETIQFYLIIAVTVLSYRQSGNIDIYQMFDCTNASNASTNKPLLIGYGPKLLNYLIHTRRHNNWCKTLKGPIPSIYEFFLHYKSEYCDT